MEFIISCDKKMIREKKLDTGNSKRKKIIKILMLFVLILSLLMLCVGDVFIPVFYIAYIFYLAKIIKNNFLFAERYKNQELVYQFQDDKLVIFCRIKNNDHNLFTYSLLWKDVYKCDFTKKEIVFYDKNNAILEKISKQDFNLKQLKEIKQFIVEKLK